MRMMDSCEEKWIGLLFLGVLVVPTVFLSNSISVSAEGMDVIDRIGVGIPMSCTMQTTGNGTHNAEITNGTYNSEIGETTIKAFCNDDSGFAIYAIGYTDNILGKNVLTNSMLGSNYDIATGLATSGNNSNWAMKLTTITSPAPDYPIAIQNSFDSFHVVPDTYTMVAKRTSATDTGSSAEGSTLKTVYQTYISGIQPTGLYSGQVKYTMVHPVTEVPAEPKTTESGKICYYPNTALYEGTMGCQTVSTSATSATLLASNFSRDGYGFAGWSDVYDYETNANANFYGPQEDIVFTAGEYTGDNPGLSLYAVWIESAGIMQLNGDSVCSGLTAAIFTKDSSNESVWSITATLSSVSALTDSRDGQTYAIAKLSDNNCWMIENLRLSNTHQENGNTIPTALTMANTNNPLNNGTSVTLKRNYTDTETYNTLSATSNVAYNADTAPGGWCTTNSTACDDQSRLRTDNTTSRASSPTANTGNMYIYGNHYNWYSATAGRGTYSKASGNTEGDLCPFGWHLPTGTGSGEYGILSNSLGGLQSNDVAQTMSSSTTPTHTIMKQRFRHFPNNFVYSGYINGASMSSRGSNGNYWTSTAQSDGVAYYFSIYSSEVRPGIGGSNPKNYGRAVRCIVSGV